MIRADERIRAVAATADAARHLKVLTGSPLLLVERVSYTYGERPVEVQARAFGDGAVSLSQHA